MQNREKLSHKILVFCRFPIPGKTKTRIIPLLGEEGAVQLHKELTEHTLQLLRNFSLSFPHPLSIEIHHDQSDSKDMKKWLGTSWSFFSFQTHHLGERILWALEKAFVSQNQKTLLLGIDCPEISPQLLEEAFHHLSNQDVVLGPTQDGGYYLIGLKKEIPQLFQSIDWGTSKVFQQTFTIAKQENLSVKTLPMLQDIDRPEDLIFWQDLQPSKERNP